MRTEPAGLVLVLDAEVAAHLAVAVYLHRERLRATGRACPDILLEIERVALQASRSAHECAGVSAENKPDGGVGYGRLVPAFHTPAECAELLGVHISTIRRWIREGELPAERRGRTIRIPRAELERLARPKETT